MEVGRVVMINGEVGIIFFAVEPAGRIFNFSLNLFKDSLRPAQIRTEVSLKQLLIIEFTNLLNVLIGNFSLDFSWSTWCFGNTNLCAAIESIW